MGNPYPDSSRPTNPGRVPRTHPWPSSLPLLDTRDLLWPLSVTCRHLRPARQTYPATSSRFAILHGRCTAEDDSVLRMPLSTSCFRAGQRSPASRKPFRATAIERCPNKERFVHRPQLIGSSCWAVSPVPSVSFPQWGNLAMSSGNRATGVDLPPGVVHISRCSPPLALTFIQLQQSRPAHHPTLGDTQSRPTLSRDHDHHRCLCHRLNARWLIRRCRPQITD